MEKFNTNNYILIQGFAVTELGLSGNELIAYCLIYGFCQDGDGYFVGSLNYLASALNITRQNAKKVLDRLAEKELIVKFENSFNGIKYCSYKTTKRNIIGVAETIPPLLKEQRGVAETATNNKYIININNKEKIIKKESKVLFTQTDLYMESIADGYYTLKQTFSGEVYDNIDLVYYFHAVADWSESKNEKRTPRGWSATIRQFIRKDKELNKLHTLNSISGGLTQDALDYLNM